MKQTKCNCGADNKITCPKCSKIKMVMLLKNGNNHLKHRRSNGRYANPVWYSHLSKNRKPKNVLINSMYQRFEKSNYKPYTNKLMFFDNQTKQHLTSVTI